MMNGLLTETYFLKNSLASWLTAFIAVAVSFTALKLFQAYGVSRLKKAAEKTETKLDDLVMAIVAATKPYFVLSLSIVIGMSFLENPVLHQTHLNFILVFLMAFQLGIWGEVAIGQFLSRNHELANYDASKATTMVAVGFLLRIGLWIVVVLLALDNLGVNISTLITGLGIGGVAVALAVQNVLGDLLASLSIVLDKPFVIGDVIQVGADIGTVEKIGLKTTRIKSLSGEQLIYSNSDLLKSQIRNYKRMDERRVPFTIGVTYDTSKDKLQKIPAIIKKIIDDEARARFDRCHMSNFAASSLDFETVYYVMSSDYNIFRDTHQNINFAVVDAFRAEGIEFAFPTRTLHMVQEAAK